MLWLVKQQQQRLLPRLAHHLLLFPSFRGLLTGVRPFSTAALRGSPSPQNPPPSPPEPTHFMVEYLVDSCGLCRAEAVKASNRLVHLKSPDKPDAVLRLLKEEGLSDAHIRRLVVSFPKVLVADAKKTLEPKFRALQGAGFSKLEVAQMISANPVFICIRNAASKIEFWRKIVGDKEKLLKIFKNYFLVGSNTTGKINANLSFLRSVGMSDRDIARIVVRRPRLVVRKLNTIMSIVEQVNSLGIEPGSSRRLDALCTVSNLSQSTLEAKSKLLRSFGWSVDELRYAFQTFPIVLRLSEKKIARAMDFLLKEAGCQPSYIARRPVLLSYNIDNRLIPRCYILQFLKKKGLPGGNVDLLAAMLIPDEKFVEKYIAPIGENIPELIETYPQVRAMTSSM